MKLNQTTRRCVSAYTLPEVMMAVAVMVVMFVTLYLGFTQGFGIIQLARENLRATQVLQEKMETVRLYTWDQINTANFIPATFKAPFYATGTQSTEGLVYHGKVTISDSAMSESYAADIKQVDVEVAWTSGEIRRRRTMSTLVSRYGLHNYIY